MQTKQIELLSPAKNLELGKAAINHGADAVYIAANKFGAREAAGNSMLDIEKLCSYAHKYYSKTYLTLNTILYDNELEEARKLILQAYNCGCDAVIIQDMGILEMDIPPIPLFASTQTDNVSPEKVKFLQDMGFQRVILARELSLKQIADIKSKTDIELESFVHGSLCVSYSGRCYLSEIVAKRSANRGCCAQICRLPFDLVDNKGTILAKNKHLLSLKDLNMSAYIEKLLEAGISSFKIEGRLKDISYVKNITAYYRKLLDKIFEQSECYKKSSSGNVSLTFEPDPEKTFSRGFTSYFAEGRKAQLNAVASKSIGKYCGKVTAVANGSFILSSNHSLANGDGICFFDNSGKLLGTRVNVVEKNLITPLSIQGIVEGTDIYRNFDRLFEKQLLLDSASRKIKTKVSIDVSQHNVKINAIDEDGITAELNFNHSMEPARNATKARETINSQFSKTGNDIFLFKVQSVNCDYFFPISNINNWRRLLINELEIERKKQYKQPKTNKISCTTEYTISELDYTANVSNRLAAQFYNKHGVKSIENAVELGTNPDKLMFNKYCIKFELGICPKKHGGNTGSLFLVSSNTKLKLGFDCNNCEMFIDKQLRQ